MKIHWCQGDTRRNPLRTILLLEVCSLLLSEMRNSHSFSLLWDKAISFKLTDSGTWDETAPANRENAAESKHQSKWEGEREKGCPWGTAIPTENGFFTMDCQDSRGLLISTHTGVFSCIFHLQISDQQLCSRIFLSHPVLFTWFECLVPFFPLHRDADLAQLAAQSGCCTVCGFPVLQPFLEKCRQSWRTAISAVRCRAPKS